MDLQGHQHPLDLLVLGLDHLPHHLYVLQLGGLEGLAVSDLGGEGSRGGGGWQAPGPGLS